MKILSTAHKQFIEKITSRNKEWNIRKFTDAESKALFEVTSYAPAVKKSHVKGRLYYVTTYPNGRLNCLHMHIGWFEPIALPDVNRIPRQSQIEGDLSDINYSTVNSDLSELLKIHPNFLPNQSLGEYLWYPHAPAIHQNHVVPTRYELALDEEDQHGKVIENCDHITSLMLKIFEEVITPYFDLIESNSCNQSQ